jgi:hypothetical protein
MAVLNGTFTTSENGVSPDRLADLTLWGPAGRTHPDLSAWSEGKTASRLTIRTGEPGTYVVGASVRPRDLELAGKEFTDYLKEEGLDDVVAARAREGTSARRARERYSQHVKALVQVGEARTEHFGSLLGYAAEIVPLENPYALRAGETLRVRALVDGAPAAGVIVLAGGRVRGTGARMPQQRLTADADGVARIGLTAAGQYYVKFIRMVPMTTDSLDYESKWATLTFEVR